MVMAILTADRHMLAEKFPADFTDVSSFTYLLFFVWLLFYGPGPVSLDWLVSRFLGSGARRSFSRLWQIIVGVIRI